MTDRSQGTLTDEQRTVAEHPLDRPGVVDAGAGTGKTHTIIGRVAYLYQTGACQPNQILLLTFARKAAAELHRRVLDLLEGDTEPPQCFTFHAFAASVLSEHAYDLGVSPDATVIEDIDARLEFRAAFDEVVYGNEVDATAFPLRTAQREALRDGLYAIAQRLKEHDITIERFLERALAAADAIKHIACRAIRPRGKGKRLRNAEIETTDEGLRTEAVDARSRVLAAAEIFRRYEERLQRRHALTYADLLLLARRGLAADPRLAAELRGRYKHCIVDEFQDTDTAQWRFLETLFGEALERVTVVGDPRQSIFAFRGAVPKNIARFGDLPKAERYVLTENRRSRQEILDLAHAIISHDTLDERPLRAQRGAAGAQIVHVSSRWATAENPVPKAAFNREAQARAVARRITVKLASGKLKPSDIAILTRNKTLIQPFTAALNDAGVPFRLLGGAGFYEAPEIRDVVAWLRLLADPLDGQAIARLCASPACGLADATMTQLAAGLGDDETAFARRVLVEPLPPPLDDDSRARVQRLRDIVDTLEPFASVSLPVALSAVIETTGLLREHERSRDRQAAANVHKLRRLANDFVARNREAHAGDFVRYIEELERIEFDDREADPPADDAVTIMTIHAAKGLEWPVVFIVDVWPSNKPMPLIWLDDSTGAMLCREGRDGAPLFHVQHALLRPDDEGFIPHEDDREPDPRDAEERRLFYVGLTRARDELYVLGGSVYSTTNKGGRPRPFVHEAETWLTNRGWAVDEPMPPPSQTKLALDLPQTRDRDRGTSLFDKPDVVERTLSALPPLSFSLLHAFERCPRSVTYRAVMRVPVLRAETGDESEDPLAEAAAFDAADPGALLAAGDYGRLVHRALERWARARIRGDDIETPEAYVKAAAAELALRPKSSELEKGVSGVRAATSSLAAWHIERTEAPFSMQYGDAMVTGFIDLIARDANGRSIILDYKTGERPASEYALQLGIYREAARRVYETAGAACAIGRFEDSSFRIEELDVPSEDVVRARIAAVAAGLRACDTTPTPGDWCWTCVYRAAPCDAYPKRKA